MMGGYLDLEETKFNEDLSCSVGMGYRRLCVGGKSIVLVRSASARHYAVFLPWALVGMAQFFLGILELEPCTAPAMRLECGCGVL